jgi:hypothetical protein
MSSGCGCGQTRHVSCNTEFQYAVKIVCGSIPPAGAAPGPVAPGFYFTAINIHNPSKCDTVAFRWKAAQALPLKAGTVSLFSTVSIGPDQALEIDNPQILSLFPPPIPFVKGFVVIQSPEELDVVAVYSVAQAANAPGYSFSIERVPARCVPVCEDLALPLSTGIADWQTFSSPGGVVGPVKAVVPAAIWMSAPAGSIWVSASANDGVNAPASPPLYVYQLCFNLCSGFSNPTLQMLGIADSSAKVFLNNVPLGSTAVFSSPPAVIPPPGPNVFQAGQNCLRVEVTNVPNPSGGPNPTGFAIAGLLRVTGGRCPCDKLPVLAPTPVGTIPGAG